MHLKTRNINTAFMNLVANFHEGIWPTYVTASRYGEVVVIEEPITVTYERPIERVLLNPYRDANCFFHLYEALYMLAGRNDLAPLAYYNKRMTEFSDDGKTLTGAYGYRWRHATKDAGLSTHVELESIDQLDLIVNHLRSKPESRRAVLQMWNVEDDLLKIDLSRDVCCNTHAYFAVELGRCTLCEAKPHLVKTCMRCGGMPHDRPQFLNLTVCNRSNDLVWGLAGANVVQFSILLEYMAARLGLQVGKYHQFTNNLHAYTKTWNPEAWLKDYQLGGKWTDRWYGDGPRKLVPLVNDPVTFEEELPRFVEHFSGKLDVEDLEVEWSEPFFKDVAQPMLTAFAAYKVKDYQTAVASVDRIEADDWREAATGWLQRRIERRTKTDA